MRQFLTKSIQIDQSESMSVDAGQSEQLQAFTRAQMRPIEFDEQIKADASR